MYGSRPQAPTPTWTLYGQGTESTVEPFSFMHDTSSHTYIYTVCRITHTADETITAALVPPAVPPCSTLEQEKQVSDKSGRDEGEFMSSCFNTGQCCLCSTGSSSRFNCEFELGECSQDFSFYSSV